MREIAHEEKNTIQFSAARCLSEEGVLAFPHPALTNPEVESESLPYQVSCS